jgi:hypothetical protein
MYFREGIHGGRPHFHAHYGGAYASFDVADLARLAGELPPRVERLVREWARIHRAQLSANWENGREGRRMKRIEPLK